MPRLVVLFGKIIMKIRLHSLYDEAINFIITEITDKGLLHFQFFFAICCSPIAISSSMNTREWNPQTFNFSSSQLGQAHSHYFSSAALAIWQKNGKQWIFGANWHRAYRFLLFSCLVREFCHDDATPWFEPRNERLGLKKIFNLKEQHTSDKQQRHTQPSR